MVRATSRAPSVGQSSVSKIRNRRKKAYKVQLESVMAKKKKLKIHDIHGSARPVPGYTFLPVGYADLAERCKEQSRQQGVDVAVVSAGKRAGIPDPQKLTHHVHRVGYHFRSDIFDQACNFLGYREINGKLVRETGFDTDSRFEQTVARYGPRLDVIDLSNDSTEESTKVKKYIRELFPKIPEEDLEEIYKRAWEQGTTTVGNASNLSLSRQVQLATIARIRHTYTDYDKLLKLVTWKEARQIVEPMSLTKLIEWRGEHENDAEDFEEILRETIVIDDDEEEGEVDSDTDSNGIISDDEGSDTSLEILQQTLAPKDLNVEVGEKPKAPRKAVPSVGKAVDRVLPTAMQNRWRDARMRQQAAGNLPPLHGRGGQISVPLDLQGNVPRKVVSGGVEYVRISSSPEPQQRESKSTNVAMPARGAGGLAGYQRASPKQINGAIPGLIDLTVPQSAGINRPPGHMPLWSRFEGRPAYPITQTVGHPIPAIDLTSPARLRGGYGDNISYTGPPEFGYRTDEPFVRTAAPGEAPRQNVYRPRMSDEDVTFARVQPRPQVRRHQSYNFGGAQDRAEILKPEDYPIPSREVPERPQPLYPYHGNIERRDISGRPPPEMTSQTRPVQHQPVFGQPAYPQMRSQTVAMQAVPRPVHGAPAAVQPMSPRERAPSVGQATFGSPPSPRYFVGASHRPFYVPDR